MELFKYKGGEITYNKELLAYNCFKKIHDNEGTVKKNTFVKILSYIYFIANPSAFPLSNGLSKEATIEYAKKYSGYSGEETVLIKECIQIYSDALNEDISEKLIRQAIGALISQSDLLKNIQEKVEDKIKSGKEDQLEKALDLSEKLFKILDGIKPRLKSLDALLEDREKAKNGERLIRGKKIYKDSYDGRGIEDEFDGSSEPESLG